MGDKKYDLTRRVVAHSQKEYVKGKTHINGLEGFSGYLKRQLTSGGVRRERLPAYLAEYVWRYNHREQQVKQQVNRLLKLIIQQYGF